MGLPGDRNIWLISSEKQKWAYSIDLCETSGTAAEVADETLL